MDPNSLETDYPKEAIYLEDVRNSHAIDGSNDSETVLHTVISYDDVAIAKNLQKNLNTDVKLRQLTYRKRKGTCGVGELYETKLLSLILYRALTNENIKEFYLATQIDDVGAFDDICVRYELKSNSTPRVIFIQAKHKEDPDKSKVSLSSLRNTSSPFGLEKYFESYLKLKKEFNADNKDDNLIFHGGFRDVNCTLVIITPAKCSIPEENKLLLEPDQIQSCIYVDKASDDIFQLKDSEEHSVIDLVLDSTASKRMEALGDILKSTILHDNEKRYSKLMNEELIKRYHVFLAQEVVSVSKTKFNEENNPESYREGKFLPSFFTSQENLLKNLYEEMFEGASPKDLDKYKAESFTFKLPITFGNIDLYVRRPRRIISLGNDFIKLFENTIDSNVIKIDESIFEPKANSIQKGFVSLNGGIAGLVGNLLVFDEQTKMLKFDLLDNLLEGNSKELLKYLLGRVDKKLLYGYRFDIYIEDFPALCIKGDQKDILLAREFLDHLWFLTNQPNECEIENKLKDKIRRQCKLEKRGELSQIHIDAVFSYFHDLVQNWWKSKGDTSNLLTTECDYLERSRIIMIGNSPLVLFNSVFMKKIEGNKFEIKDTVVQVLCVNEFIQNQADDVLNIITTETFFTIIKLAQYCKRNDKVDVKFLDFGFIIDENYYRDVESELKNISQNFTSTHTSNITTKIIVIILKRQKDISKLCDIIKSVPGDPNTKVIIVSENDISNEIESKSYKKCIVKRDKRVYLDDILDIDNLTNRWKVSFQGQEVQFNYIIDDISKKFIHSELLRKLISNEHLEIGNPFTNPRYNKIKDYCIRRQLSRDGRDFTVDTFKDIDETVVVVDAEPGMGKSTLLNQLAVRTKELDQKSSNQGTWIIYIDLSNYKSEYERWKKEKVNIDSNEALRFIQSVSVPIADSNKKQGNTNKSDLNDFNNRSCIAESQLDRSSKDEAASFQLELLTHYYHNGDVIFLLDTFDEVYPDYKMEVLSLLKVLSEHCLNRHQQRMWVSTRSYKLVKNALEEVLAIKSYTLKPLSIPEQGSCLKQYMRIHFRFSTASEKELLKKCGFFDYMEHLLFEGNVNIQHVPLIGMYTVAALYFNSITLGCIDNEVNIRYRGIYRQIFETEYNNIESMKMYENPFHLWMAAEYFRHQIEDENVPISLCDKINKWDVKSKVCILINNFLDIKMKKIRFEEKKNSCIHKTDPKSYEILHKNFQDKHKKLALCSLFDDNDLLLSNIITKRELKSIHNMINGIDSGGEDYGVVDRVVDKKPRFVHTMFAEFFVAEHISDKLKEAFSSEDVSFDGPQQEVLWNFILNVILFKGSPGVRTFFDRKFEEDSVLLDTISCERSKYLVFEALLKQSRTHRGTLDGFPIEVVKTSLNIVLEESLFNIQNYFLDCFKHGVNDDNIKDFLGILCNSGMVTLSAIGASNEKFLFKLCESIEHVCSDDVFADTLVPFASFYPLKALDTLLSRLWGFEISDCIFTPRLRVLVKAKMKSLWDSAIKPTKWNSNSSSKSSVPPFNKFNNKSLMLKKSLLFVIIAAIIIQILLKF